MKWLLLVFATIPLAVAAPHSKGWESLAGLHAGDTVEVATQSGATVGEFVSSSTATLTIHNSQGDQQFSRADVVRVVSRARSRRMRNLLIGAGIGLGISIVTDATLGTYLRNESNPDMARPLIWTLPIAAGAALGALMPGYQVCIASSRKRPSLR